MKYIIAVLFLFIISCASEADKPLEVRDGLLYEAGSDTPFTGIEKGFVNNRHVEYEVVKGEKHGYFKIMDVDGKLITSGHLVHNKYEGKWEYFYPDGKLESEGYFKDHNATDVWKWYYPNGNLKESGSFLDGEREGEWKSFYEDGRVMRTKMFHDGKLVNEGETEEKL